MELSVCGRRWQYSGAVKEGEAAIFAEKLLQQRGVAGADIERFLNPTLKDLMPDPGLIPDIVCAADRLMQAIVGAEDITFLADFDVDGASSAALLFQYCTFFGLRPLVEVPERLIEGFGPNRRILDAVASRGGGLMLCLDCGTAAVDLFDEYAERLHVIIVDHHQPGAVLPPVYAIVNPMCSKQGRQAFGDLAAVGVVFMLLVVTNQHLKAAGHAVPNLKGLLDLVLLGTVCDMVPMRGLNRAFVHRGLECLNTAPRVGVAALMQVSGVKPMLARPEDISFS
ncbi:MAG: single-stranded-DNA-specific exonuclease RecJ, partial [Alphaproteobacteria bacterium]|nr:single-stranded-DNA-specific exonuclease RecJ [Alphaproteobacteria bacterium]